MNTATKPQARPDVWQTAAELAAYLDCHTTTLGAKAIDGETLAGFTIERLEVGEADRAAFGRAKFKYRAIRLVPPAAEPVEVASPPDLRIVDAEPQPSLPLRPGRVSTREAAAVLLADVAAELAEHAAGSVEAVEATTIAAWLAKRATR